MTASASSPPERAGAGNGADAVAGMDDATDLAAQPLPPGGMWLLAMEVEQAEGGLFSVRQMPAEDGECRDGDVLVHVAAGPGILPGLGSSHVQVCAVMGGALSLVAEWPVIEASDWPELARPAAGWAMGALAGMDQAGIGPGSSQVVPLAAAVAAMTAGWPALPGIELPGSPD